MYFRQDESFLGSRRGIYTGLKMQMARHSGPFVNRKTGKIFLILAAAFSFCGFWMALPVILVLDRCCSPSQTNQ